MIMNQRIAELPWTDEQWNRVCKTVCEEAQRTRVAAKFLPIYGPVGSEEVAVPNVALDNNPNRLTVNSLPDTTLATLSVLVHVRNHEAADPELQAVLTMFRRAANLIARTEDGLMFGGQPRVGMPPRFRPRGPIVVTGGRAQQGLLGNRFGLPAGDQTARPGTPRRAHSVSIHTPGRPGPLVDAVTGATDIAAVGKQMISKIVNAIGLLESSGYGPPYACVLDGSLYEAVNTPAPSLIAPRQTILPLLQGGPLLRSSMLLAGCGILVAYESGQVEQVLASDITVKFLQVSLEPRFVFRVSERLALRVRDWSAIVNLQPYP
jgi:uncharacterized linocin/CFP29 family protein